MFSNLFLMNQIQHDEHISFFPYNCFNEMVHEKSRFQISMLHFQIQGFGYCYRLRPVVGLGLFIGRKMLLIYKEKSSFFFCFLFSSFTIPRFSLKNLHLVEIHMCVFISLWLSPSISRFFFTNFYICVGFYLRI